MEGVLTTQDKLAIGIEYGMGVAEYGLATDYATLAATWRDVRPLPSEEQILAWAELWRPPVERSKLAIHAAQLREMLTVRGIRATVEAAIAAAEGPEGEILRDWYEYAPTIRRDSPKVEGLRVALGIEADTLDEWFRVAMGYE